VLWEKTHGEDYENCRQKQVGNSFEVLSPWQGYPPKKRKERKTTELIEVFEMLGDPRKLNDLPEDVRAILKFIRLESFLQEA
jgi:hypothetical protein